MVGYQRVGEERNGPHFLGDYRSIQFGEDVNAWGYHDQSPQAGVVNKLATWSNSLPISYNENARFSENLEVVDDGCCWSSMVVISKTCFRYFCM
jgi:hypothetical protein